MQCAAAEFRHRCQTFCTLRTVALCLKINTLNEKNLVVATINILHTSSIWLFEEATLDQSGKLPVTPSVVKNTRRRIRGLYLPPQG